MDEQKRAIGQAGGDIALNPLEDQPIVCLV